MSIFSRYSHSFFKSPARGFTIVELLVVVAIVVLITSFVLFRHARFDSSTLLRSLSYNVALSMRQAQVYGTSVRGIRQGGLVEYAPGYGVYFASSLGCDRGPDTCYVLFADRDGDRVYDIDERVATQNLGRSFTIRAYCARHGGGTHCSTDGGGISFLTVYFRRPNPEALIYTSSAATTYSDAYVELQSSAESVIRRVKVTSTGQIAVCNLNDTIESC